MTDPEGNKRQRADNSPTKNSHMQTPSHQASPALAASEMHEPTNTSAAISMAAAEDSQGIRALLERLLTLHEQLAADVSRLQHSVDTVLNTLHPPPAAYPAREPLSTREMRPTSAPRRTSQHMSLPAYTYGSGRQFSAVPPSLANIVSPPTQSTDLTLAERPPASASPTPQYKYGGERARAASSGDAAASIADNSSTNVGLPQVQRPHVHEYPRAGAHSPATRFYGASPPMPSQPAVATAGSQIALAPPGGLAPPAGVLRSTPTQGFPRVQSPTSAVFGSQTRFQLQSPSSSVPLSAPSSSSSAYPPARHAASHRGEYRPQQHSTTLPRLSHQTHLQYTPQAAPPSPYRMQPMPGYSEQAVPTQPIVRPSAARMHNSSQYLRGPGPQKEAPGTSPYSASVGAASMMIDATPVPAPKPSPQLGHLGLAPPLTADSALSGGMVESPTGSVSSRVHIYPNMPGDRSFVVDAGLQQKQEKNRFQANIRAFVDQHFMVPTNMRWDYQQSFKAPHNAEATQQIVESFSSLHGGTFERIQHGLGVYFSSLKAKHRSSEEKTMVKQQRDRRRARRIKKATGRRKVFVRGEYPFLEEGFDPERCIIPLTTSPEHTDEDNEVKVGVLPWRLDKYTKLFHHLDTMRTKRTIRLSNPYLSGGSVPPHDIPDFMIAPEYLAMDRSRRSQDPDHDPEEHSHDPEEDIEMGSSSD